MLEPDGRVLLLTALRPPLGFTFDEGVGTTFSLDLLTLLTAPLAFTLFDTEDQGRDDVAGSLEVLHSVRQYASRLTVFCHGSRVSVPRIILTQYAFLEDSIVECQGQRRSLFHPKVWLLRFVDAKGQHVYRLLCLTRNLTFANSWDTALVLDGVPTARRQERNAKLVDFVRALPAWAIRQPQPQAVVERAARLADEVDRVEFALPDGFTELRFWPLGRDDWESWPFDRRGSRLLVMSPFLTAGCLDRLGDAAPNATVVSTREDLIKLPHKPKGFTRFCVLHEAAVADFLDGEASSTDRDVAQLNGLHAKCFVMERGSNVHVWTGSANATDAAFAGNVEFLTELIGPTRRFSVDALLTSDPENLRFGNLVIDVEHLVATKQPDPGEEDLRERVELARALLTEARLAAVASGSDEDRWTLRVSGVVTESLPDGLTVWCWPLAASARRQRVAGATRIDLTFSELTFDALSAFFVFHVDARVSGKATECEFVLTLPLEGVPADRAERIVKSLIKDRTALMRFLFLLLSDEAQGEIGGGGSGGSSEPWEWSAATPHGLFELMVRALEQRPSRIDEIARLIADLRDDGRQSDVLPPGFEELWDVIWAARTEGSGV